MLFADFVVSLSLGDERVAVTEADVVDKSLAMLAMATISPPGGAVGLNNEVSMGDTRFCCQRKG